ncbi:hypothetical protein D3C87_1398640 [compost metagenome]
MGASAGPLQVGILQDRPQADVRAEGRRVPLGDAIGIEDLGGDAVLIENARADGGVPGAFHAFAGGGAPLVVEIVEQEVLFVLLTRSDFLGDAHVEFGAILRIEILAILLRRQTGMTIRRNYQIPIHGTLPRFFNGDELIFSSADF